MGLLSVPFPNFTAGTTIVSAQVNANFAAVVAWSTNIDTTNIGAAGINISKLVGTGLTVNTGNDSITLPGGLILKWGKVTGVKADGSAASAVVFTTPFPTNMLGVQITVSNAFQSNPWGVTNQTTSESVTGFSINVGGAPAASTVTVWWWAVGN